MILCSVDLAQIPAANPSSSTHVGFIGRLEEQKDPLLFLDVMGRLADYTASMVGGGSLDRVVRAEIHRRGLSNVRMLGRLAHEESLRALATFGVLVMTSRWEGLPILCLEAMAAGVPVVATHVGGLSEAVESGRGGILVGSRSADEIARAVRQMAEDRTLRERVVRHGRDRAARLFSLDRMLASLEEVYRQALE